MLLRTRCLAVATCAVTLLIPPRARAQDNSAAVEALFNEGKRLAGEGKYAEACPKFLASYNLESRVGTLLNLADCYEKNGRLASAWARFVEARTLAQRHNQAERAAYASEHAANLAPRLSKLAVNVPNAPAGIKVKRDGVVIEAGAYGVAVAVDGGKHTIEASAPGKKTWTSEIALGLEGDVKSIDVPALDDAPKAAVEPARAPVPEEHVGSGRTIAGLSLAGAGVVVIGLGTYFGVVALGKKSDSNKDGNCGINGQPNDCTQAGATLRDDARTDGTVSTVLIGVGAAAVAGGLVLWLTAPSRRTATSMGFDGRTVRIGGQF